MKKAIPGAIKQAVSGKGMYIGILAAATILLLSSVQDVLQAFRSEELLENGFHHTFIMNALTSDAMTLALPIIAALPFTSSFIDDIKSGFVKEYLPRTTKSGYLLGKILGSLISGGLAVSLGVLLSYIIAALVFSPMEAAVEPGAVSQPYFEELMGKVLLFFCSGAFWSLVGLTFATLTSSKYMAYASPFVLYYVLIILYERYFDTLYVLYPKEWTNPSEFWMWGNTGVVLLILELIIIFSLLFSHAAKRRLEQI